MGVETGVGYTQGMANFRPRLRFSLRTLFVLVTICGAVIGYVGWQWRIVQERKAVFALLGAYEMRPAPQPAPAIILYWPDDLPLPWVRRLMGDSKVPSWGRLSYRVTAADLQRIKRALPEAVIETQGDSQKLQ